MLLVRHAQSKWNLVFGTTRVDAAITDPELTEEGLATCREAAAALATEGLTRIVASPYRRTLQTALIIADTLRLPVGIDPAVRERCAFSCDQGSPASVLRRDFPDLDLATLDEIWWGHMIESAPSILDRARSFLVRAREWPDQDSVLVVSHWGFIRCVTGLEVGNLATARLDPFRSPADSNAPS